MTKIQEIYEFLSGLENSVSEKHQFESVIRIREEKKAEKTKKLEDLEYAKQLAEIHEHTKGQLYEINYIIKNFWEIISKDNY